MPDILKITAGKYVQFCVEIPFAGIVRHYEKSQYQTFLEIKNLYVYRNEMKTRFHRKQRNIFQ